MDINFKQLKEIVDNTVLCEAKCVQIMHTLLSKENATLHNTVLEEIISVLGKWSTTPPIEILKELEDFQSQQNST